MLYQEAVCQVILGERRCPREVPLVAFLAQSMRVASHRRKTLSRQVPTSRTDGAGNLVALQIAADQLDPEEALIERVYSGQESIEELLGRGPKLLIANFLAHYASIDWSIHGRLTHFRNLGVAHLSTQPLGKSITFDELRFMARIASKLADELVALCRVTFASVEPMLDDWSERGFSILKVRD